MAHAARNTASKASYFTRGSGHNDAAKYTEDPEEYQAVMDRLAQKFEKMRALLPAPVVVKGGSSRIENQGSVAWPMVHRLRPHRKPRPDQAALWKDVDYMRIRAWPFAHEIHDFVASHDRIYVVEQDRDAQLASFSSSIFPPPR